MKKPTHRQRQVLNLIRDFIAEFNRSPTFREISTLMGATSPGAATDMVRKLEAHGFISRDRLKHRSIQLVEPDASIDKDTEFDRLISWRDFSKIRLDAILALQSQMPEPWRTKVCNILANGTAG